jgi:hypothetical protein
MVMLVRKNVPSSALTLVTLVVVAAGSRVVAGAFPNRPAYPTATSRARAWARVLAALGVVALGLAIVGVIVLGIRQP